MSEFVREALPIFFMYGVVLLLGPLIGITMWMAFDGDRLREGETQADLAPILGEGNERERSAAPAARASGDAAIVA